MPTTTRSKLNSIPSTIFSSALRIWYLYNLTTSTESSWIGFRLMVASVTETHVSIICACAPLLKASFRRFFGGHAGAAVNRYQRKPEMNHHRVNALFPSEGLSVSDDSKTSTLSFTDVDLPTNKPNSSSSVTSVDSAVPEYLMSQSNTPKEPSRKNPESSMMVHRYSRDYNAI
jgi:hypothetical protein